MLPHVDHPEAFGQHPNADIASQIIETRSGSAYFYLLQKSRQLLQWLTSKLKDSLHNGRYVFAFFRRARSGRGGGA